MAYLPHTRSGLADLPAEGHDADLGLLDVAEAMATFVSKCATPLTIGLQGDWGTGKTSLMNFVRDRIRQPNYGSLPYVWFNTWTYSQFKREEHLPVSLMLSLMRRLQILVAEEASAIDHNKFTNKLRRFGKAAARVAAAYVRHQTQGALDLTSVGELFDPEQTVTDEAELAGNIKSTFSDVVKEFLQVKQVERLVVFIDDLDRIRPSRAIEILEIIKNFLDVDGCVFVLAIDYDVVIKGLTERKGIDLESGEGKSFFDKLIQVPFRMPVSLYTADKFVARHIDGAGMASGRMRSFWLDGDEARYRLKILIKHSVRQNPRSIKRMLNLIEFHTILLNRSGSQGNSDDHHVVLLPLTALQMMCDPAYQFIVQAGKSLDLALMALWGIYLCPAKAANEELTDDELETWRQRLYNGFSVTSLAVSKSPIWAASLNALESEDEVLYKVLRQVHDLRLTLEKRQYGFTKRNFNDIQVVAELLFRAIDANGDGILADEEKRRVSALLSVASLTGDDESASAADSGFWTPEEFLEQCKTVENGEGRALALGAFLSTLEKEKDVGIYGGSGEAASLHIGAVRGSKKGQRFITVYEDGGIRVNLNKPKLSDSVRKECEQWFQEEYAINLAGYSKWMSIQEPVWDRDPQLTKLADLVVKVARKAAAKL